MRPDEAAGIIVLVALGAVAGAFLASVVCIAVSLLT